MIGPGLIIFQQKKIARWQNYFGNVHSGHRE